MSAERIEEILDVFEADDGELWRVLEAIAERPHRVLTPRSPLVTPADATAIAPEGLAYSLAEAGAIGLTTRRQDFLHDEKKWRFLKVYDDRHEVSTDTAPNRFTAYFLGAIASELRKLLRAPCALEGEQKEDAAYLKRRLQVSFTRLTTGQEWSPLREVPHDDQVLNHDPRYRRVLLAYLELLG